MTDWQVIDIIPEGMVLVIPLFILGQNRRKSLIESPDWGDEGIFFALSVKCKKTPWAHEQKNNTVFVFATEAGFIISSDMATSWMTGNLTPQKMALHQTAATLHVGCHVRERAHMHEQKGDPCVFFSPVALVKLQL